MGTNVNGIWIEALNSLSGKVDALAYDIWINSITPLCVVMDKLILKANTEAHVKILEKKFHEIISGVVISLFPFIKHVEIISPDQEEDFLFYCEAQKNSEDTSLRPMNAFIPKYTFENFVVGKSNQFVCAACESVTKNPGKEFNPLFIYGGVGLGKTHLMHAIGNRLSLNRPDLKCMYVSSERFTNDLIDALKDSGKINVMKKFRNIYRNVDVLMIDDIQFISKTVSTQEELFHTFNELYFSDKQIIISSDRPPKEITPLEERLRTRFEGGLIADIQPPEYETRIAILKKKAQREFQNINYDILGLIADKVQNNIREMEGLLTKVISYASLTDRSPNSKEVVEEALKDYYADKCEIITMDSITENVCDYFKVGKDELLMKRKTKELVEPRQICMYLMTDMLSLPLAAIGDYFCGRDHTTVMYARDKIVELIKNPDSKTARAIRDVRNLIFKR